MKFQKQALPLFGLICCLLVIRVQGTVLAPASCFEASHWVYADLTGRTGNCIENYVSHCDKYDPWSGQCSSCSTMYHNELDDNRNECHLDWWGWLIWVLVAILIIILICFICGALNRSAQEANWRDKMRGKLHHLDDEE